MQTQIPFFAKYKSLIILVLDFILMLVLINTLPFSPKENRGLALLTFIGILWLTEAFNITVTSLMVPILAIGLGLINTQKALAPFATPIIYMFFGGFVIAAVLQIQQLDKIIANYIVRLAKGNLKLSVAYLFVDQQHGCCGNDVATYHRDVKRVECRKKLSPVCVYLIRHGVLCQYRRHWHFSR